MLVDLTQLQNVSINDQVTVEVDQVDLVFDESEPNLPVLQFTLTIYDKTGAKLDTLIIPIAPSYETRVFTYETTDEKITKVEDLQAFQNDLQKLYKQYGKDNVTYTVKVASTTDKQSNTKKTIFNVTFRIKTGLYWELINYSCKTNTKLAFCFYDLIRDKINDILQLV